MVVVGEWVIEPGFDDGLDGLRPVAGGVNPHASLLDFITLMGAGIVVWFTKDLAVLDAMDSWVGSFCIFILATIQTFLYD